MGLIKRVTSDVYTIASNCVTIINSLRFKVQLILTSRYHIRSEINYKTTVKIIGSLNLHFYRSEPSSHTRFSFVYCRSTDTRFRSVSWEEVSTEREPSLWGNLLIEWTGCNFRYPLRFPSSRRSIERTFVSTSGSGLDTLKDDTQLRNVQCESSRSWTPDFTTWRWKPRYLHNFYPWCYFLLCLFWNL